MPQATPTVSMCASREERSLERKDKVDSSLQTLELSANPNPALTSAPRTVVVTALKPKLSNMFTPTPQRFRRLLHVLRIQSRYFLTVLLDTLARGTHGGSQPEIQPHSCNIMNSEVQHARIGAGWRLRWPAAVTRPGEAWSVE